MGYFRYQFSPGGIHNDHSRILLQVVLDDDLALVYKRLHDLGRRAAATTTPFLLSFPDRTPTPTTTPAALGTITRHAATGGQA